MRNMRFVLLQVIFLSSVIGQGVFSPNLKTAIIEKKSSHTAGMSTFFIPGKQGIGILPNILYFYSRNYNQRTEYLIGFNIVPSTIAIGVKIAPIPKMAIDLEIKVGIPPFRFYDAPGYTYLLITPMFTHKYFTFGLKSKIEIYNSISGKFTGDFLNIFYPLVLINLKNKLDKNVFIELQRETLFTTEKEKWITHNFVWLLAFGVKI